MALAMSRPFKHPRTGVFWLRKAVPGDLRAAVGKREELRSLGTKDPEEAKRRFATALAEVETRWANLRRGPSTLLEREAHELAQPVHDQLIARYRDNPSEQTAWNPDVFPSMFKAPEYVDGRLVEAPNFVLAALQASWCSGVAEAIIRQKGLTTDELSKDRLVKAIAAALQRASLTLAALSRGEVAGSPAATTGIAGSPGVPVTQTTSKAVTFGDLVDGWAREKRPVAKTEYEWRRVLNRLAAFLGHDNALTLTADDLLRWKASMVEAGLRPKTIRDAQLAPVRAVFRWGADNRLIGSNPAERVTIDVRQKPGEGRRGFNDAEARAILTAASAQADPVLKWIPLLCAYSGARVSEVAQLRTQDIVLVEEIWCMRFDPEAGSLKNVNSERTVPLHDAMMRRGFVDYVQRLRPGPIFAALPPDKFGKRGGNGTKVLGRWVRGLGLTDERLAPNHSWRHRFKTVARRFGLAPDIVDAITGHAPRSVGDSYGDFPISALARELSKMPDVLTADTQLVPALRS